MRVTRIRKAGQRCYSELGASRGAAAFSREKLSVLCVEGTVLFRVRGTVGGESVSKGTDGTHFVGEPVGSISSDTTATIAH